MTAPVQTYLSPAKLNLDLRITGRRANGYHDLESIFTLIDLYDEISLRQRNDNKIILHTPIVGVAEQDNLLIRAAQSMQPFAQKWTGLDIWLKKRIPMGGGLGGGSSNAATLMLILNHLWQCHLKVETLIQIGVQLGADVPFFLFGRTAFARGIGEQLQAFEMPSQSYIILHPPVHISTAQIFNHPDLHRHSQPSDQPTFENLQPFRNDMQATVFQAYPEVKQAHQALLALGAALMTGSGSCVFVPQRSLQEAKHNAQKLPENSTIYCVNQIERHPVLTLFPHF